MRQMDAFFTRTMEAHFCRALFFRSLVSIIDRDLFDDVIHDESDVSLHVSEISED